MPLSMAIELQAANIIIMFPKKEAVLSHLKRNAPGIQKGDAKLAPIWIPVISHY